MNIFNKTKAPSIFESLSEDIINENSYGLEYILDEIFTVKKMNVSQDRTADWSGLTDLTI